MFGLGLVDWPKIVVILNNSLNEEIVVVSCILVEIDPFSIEMFSSPNWYGRNWKIKINNKPTQMSGFCFGGPLGPKFELF